MDESTFLRRFRRLFSRHRMEVPPPLTPDSLAALRALAPSADSASGLHRARFQWRRVGGEAARLVRVTLEGLVAEPMRTRLLRDQPPPPPDDGETPECLVCPLPGGKLLTRVVPAAGGGAAKICLFVQGDPARHHDLAVELSGGGRLIEARPLREKTEMTVGAVGHFVITLFEDVDELGRIEIDIAGAEESIVNE